MCRYSILCLIFFWNIVSSRDFYAGVFNKNDFLVAQDRVYKERVMYRTNYAKYGRHFKCPITYFRVQDRLGVGRGPRVEVIRGGLRQRFLVLRLTAVYNQPVSVNVYVGCENKNKPKLTRATQATAAESTTDSDNNGTEITDAGGPNETTNVGMDPDGTTPEGNPDETTPGANEETTPAPA